MPSLHASSIPAETTRYDTSYVSMTTNRMMMTPFFWFRLRYATLYCHAHQLQAVSQKIIDPRIAAGARKCSLRSLLSPRGDRQTEQVRVGHRRICALRVIFIL